MSSGPDLVLGPSREKGSVPCPHPQRNSQSDGGGGRSIRKLWPGLISPKRGRGTGIQQAPPGEQRRLPGGGRLSSEACNLDQELWWGRASWVGATCCGLWGWAHQGLAQAILGSSLWLGTRGLPLRASISRSLRKQQGG